MSTIDQEIIFEKYERKMLCGAVCRQQMAVDLLSGVLSNLKGSRYYKQQLKRKIGEAERFVDRYSADVWRFVGRYGVDEEQVRDAVYEFAKHLKRTRWYYTQTVTRMCQTMRLENLGELVPLIVAKDLLALSGIIAGDEYRHCPSKLYHEFLGLGGKERQHVVGHENLEGNTMAWLEKCAEQIIHFLMVASGQKTTAVYELTDKNDIGRQLSQTTDQFINSLTDYNFFDALLEGKSYEEALEAARKADERDKVRLAKYMEKRNKK